MYNKLDQLINNILQKNQNEYPYFIIETELEKLRDEYKVNNALEAVKIVQWEIDAVTFALPYENSDKHTHLRELWQVNDIKYPDLQNISKDQQVYFKKRRMYENTPEFMRARYSHILWDLNNLDTQKLIDKYLKLINDVINDCFTNDVIPTIFDICDQNSLSLDKITELITEKIVENPNTFYSLFTFICKDKRYEKLTHEQRKDIKNKLYQFGLNENNEHIYADQLKKMFPSDRRWQKLKIKELKTQLKWAEQSKQSLLKKEVLFKLSQIDKENISYYITELQKTETQWPQIEQLVEIHPITDLPQLFQYIPNIEKIKKEAEKSNSFLKLMPTCTINDIGETETVHESFFTQVCYYISLVPLMQKDFISNKINLTTLPKFNLLDETEKSALVEGFKLFKRGQYTSSSTTILFQFERLLREIPLREEVAVPKGKWTLATYIDKYFTEPRYKYFSKYILCTSSGLNLRNSFAHGHRFQFTEKEACLLWVVMILILTT